MYISMHETTKYLVSFHLQPNISKVEQNGRVRDIVALSTEYKQGDKRNIFSATIKKKFFFESDHVSVYIHYIWQSNTKTGIVNNTGK